MPLEWTELENPMGAELTQHITQVERVGIRYNADARKIAFTVARRMTYLAGVETLKDAKARVEELRDGLATVKTMSQLLKALDARPAASMTRVKDALPDTPARPVTDEDVADLMMAEGGSFVAALGAAFRKADLENRRKVIATWWEYWAEYKDRVDRKREYLKRKSR